LTVPGTSGAPRGFARWHSPAGVYEHGHVSVITVRSGSRDIASRPACLDEVESQSIDVALD
jgi:hypothetical protein